MALTITCEAMGFGERHSVTGETQDELIRKMQDHLKAEHDYTEEQAQSQDTIEYLRGAMRQSARPSDLRSPR